MTPSNIPRPKPKRTRRRVAIRDSTLHGRGAFAASPIRTGTRIVEYAGERIDSAAVRKRYGGRGADDPHTLLFQIGPRSYIDASIGGNAARFINHSCEPNCEAVQDGDRILIVAMRGIPPGEELTYDYSLQIERRHSAARARLYACRCGAARCRGTMLETAGRPTRRT